jgi:hypothetical protein
MLQQAALIHRAGNLDLGHRATLASASPRGPGCRWHQIGDAAILLVACGWQASSSASRGRSAVVGGADQPSPLTQLGARARRPRVSAFSIS